MSAPEVAAGQELPARTYRVTRADLVRYAGASGDRNPIHWSDRVATAVGLPGVIAHGMYTQGLLARAAAEALPGEVVEIGCKFTAPVVVPDDDEGVEVTFAGTVASVEDGLATVRFEATCGGTKVLGAPRVVVRLAGPGA